MTDLLGDEARAYWQSLDRPAEVGLRVNTLKISVEEFLRRFPYPLEPVRWCEDGFYYRKEDPVTKHPYYFAGLFYLQEPSAMVPASALVMTEEDLVLDLCAAPGGKSLQIAAKHRQGPLLINDISNSRLKTVLFNLEKYGIKNAVVLNEEQNRLAEVLRGRLGAVLIDAPCSGEGMFRKDPKAAAAWEEKGVSSFISIQKSLLLAADTMLMSGGRLVYSTCTFNRRENEEQLITRCEDGGYKKVPPLWKELATGEGFGRIWPHCHRGEGHFFASLVKSGKKAVPSLPKRKTAPPPKAFDDFVEEAMVRCPEGQIIQKGGKVYVLPSWDIDLSGLKVLRTGWMIGHIQRHGFSPSNALAIGADPNLFVRKIDFSQEDPNVIKYLKGETLFCQGPDGWTLITVDGFGLGFAKMQNGQLKNQYQKTWRYR